MYLGEDTSEFVSVVGTPAFMDFVESIQSEGVKLDYRPMGTGTSPKSPLIIEVDKENKKKNVDKLDIEIPIVSARIYREYKNLDALNPASFTNKKLPYHQFSDEEKRKIVFRDIATGEVNHTTMLDSTTVAEYQSVVGYFAQVIMKYLHLVSGYDVLFGKIKEFISSFLFACSVRLDDPNTLRNLAEPEVTKTVIETFVKEINRLTIQDRGVAEIQSSIRLKDTRPFVAKEQSFYVPQKSVFNKIIGDSQLELKFASFLDNCPDVIAYAKNYFAVHFTLDYVSSKGNISNYYPDFIVKLDDNTVVIAETKGLEDIDVPLKMARLEKWCEDINAMQKATRFDYVFVDEEDFDKYKPSSFEMLLKICRKYK